MISIITFNVQSYSKEYNGIKTNLSRMNMMFFAGPNRKPINQDIIFEDAKTNKQMDKEELAKFLEKMGAPKELLDKIKHAKNVEVCEVGCIECGEEDEEDDE